MLDKVKQAGYTGTGSWLGPITAPAACWEATASRCLFLVKCPVRPLFRIIVSCISEAAEQGTHLTCVASESRSSNTDIMGRFSSRSRSGDCRTASIFIRSCGGHTIDMRISECQLNGDNSCVGNVLVGNRQRKLPWLPNRFFFSALWSRPRFFLSLILHPPF